VQYLPIPERVAQVSFIRAAPLDAAHPGGWVVSKQASRNSPPEETPYPGQPSIDRGELMSLCQQVSLPLWTTPGDTCSIFCALSQDVNTTMPRRYVSALAGVRSPAPTSRSRDARQNECRLGSSIPAISARRRMICRSPQNVIGSPFFFTPSAAFASRLCFRYTRIAHLAVCRIPDGEWDAITS
jgi:hypothetical protein